MANKIDVIEMFAILQAFDLGNTPVLQPTSKLDAVASVWAEVMDDVPGPDLKVAAKEYVKSFVFWPKPADIRKLCPSLQKQAAQIEAAKSDDGMDLWAKVMKYVGSLGRYCKPAEWKQRIVRDLPCTPERAPAVIAGIEAAGWLAICNSENEWQQKDLGKAFSRAYQQQAVTGQKVIPMQDYKRLSAANGGNDDNW